MLRPTLLAAFVLSFTFTGCDRAGDGGKQGGATAARAGPTASGEAGGAGLAPGTPPATVSAKDSQAGVSTATWGPPRNQGPNGVPTLEWSIVTAGTGPSPKLGSTVKAHVVGRLADGTVFIDTRKHGVPKEYKVDSLSLQAGMVQTFLSMKQGEIRRVRVPSHLGYGAEGYRNLVPPNADLDLEIELVSVGP